jgi:hypothetical protein
MSNEREAVITAPKFETAEFHVIGTAPLVQHRFWKKGEIMQSQSEGKTGKRSRKPPRDFEADYLKSAHKAKDGWYGLPASAFRNAMISACRLVGFKMTLAKLSVWVKEDGFDLDGYPLVRLTSGEPRRHDAYVRNQTGVIDIRSRAMFENWTATVRITFDADQFTLTDVANLLARCGGQVGIGEGRPDSKESAGMGWGTFRILTHEEIMRGAKHVA